MPKSIIDSILDNIFDSNWVGKRGETLTERELKLVRLFGRKGQILKNIYVPKDNGETSEIDVIYITQKGIFVIESKNYSGWIFGDEDSYNWTVMLPNKQKNKFYNPIKQNKTHIKWLSSFLNFQIPFFSIIAFSERCELKKVNLNSSDVKVIKRDRLYATIRNIWENTADAIDEISIMEIKDKLSALTNVDEAIKQAHISNIKEKYDNQTTVKNDEIKSEERICPKCGVKLIQRVVKKGENAGKQFYGCSNFPKCRYTEELSTVLCDNR